MASTKEYLDFVIEQLSGMDEISYRAMMGEYILYYRGRVFGGIYDNRLLVKPVPTVVKLMPDAPMELPYDGAKEMIRLFFFCYGCVSRAASSAQYASKAVCSVAEAK